MTRRVLAPAILAGLSLLAFAPAAPANARPCELGCILANVDCQKTADLGDICVPPLLP